MIIIGIFSVIATFSLLQDIHNTKLINCWYNNPYFSDIYIKIVQNLKQGSLEVLNENESTWDMNLVIWTNGNETRRYRNDVFLHKLSALPPIKHIKRWISARLSISSAKKGNVFCWIWYVLMIHLINMNVAESFS